MQTQTDKPAAIVEAVPSTSSPGWTRYLHHQDKRGHQVAGIPVDKNKVDVMSSITPGEEPLVIVNVRSGNFGLQRYPSVSDARAMAAALLLSADAVEAAIAEQAASVLAREDALAAGAPQ